MAIVIDTKDDSRTSVTAVSIGVVAINPKPTVIGKGSVVRVPLGIEVHVPEGYECEMVLSEAITSNTKLEFVTLAVHQNVSDKAGYTLQGVVRMKAKKSVALTRLDTLAFIKYKEKPLND